MTVLVAYGTTNGSTGEIAEWVGDQLRAGGLAVEVRPAADVRDVSGYEAVVLGGAVYAGGWHRDSHQFGYRFSAPLATRPVWLFSSGPLDMSAEESEVPPSPQAAEILLAVRARGHTTFGGRVSDETCTWPGCDFRNPARVRDWARGIAADLQRVPAR